MKREELRYLQENFRLQVVWPVGGLAQCALAPLDPRGRECYGPIEAAHAISRQRVRNALGALLPAWYEQTVEEPLPLYSSAGWKAWRDELITIAEFDPRNGVPACEGHHRRWDSHATPELKVPLHAVPPHVIDFAQDWGLESDLERRFPVEVAACP